MKQVLISGYLGFENFGDEALLHVLINNLLEIGFKKENITVISKEPKVTTNIYNVYSINRLNLFEFLSALFKSKAIIFIGGLFQDKTSFRSFFYYFLQLFLSEILGKEIIFYGVGIGPLQQSISRTLFDFAIKSVNQLTVRDQASLATIPYRGVLVTCDPVWSIKADYTFKNQIPNVNWQLPILGVSMRNDKYLKGYHLTKLADKLARVLDGMKDWQVLLIPCMPQEDLPVLYELYNLIEKKISPQGRVILLENFNQFSIPHQAGILASCEAVVGMRYHALLIPLANEKPVFGLIYDQKIKSLLDFANQVGVSYRDDLDQAWSYFWQNIQHSQEMAKQAKLQAEELNKRNTELLERLYNT